MKNVTNGNFQPSPLWVFLLSCYLLFLPCNQALAGDSTGRSLTGHRGEIFALAFDPNNKILASAGGDQEIRLWHAKTGRLQTILKGHSGTIRTLAFSPKGGYLASGASDKTTRVWDLETGKEVSSFSSVFGNIRTVRFSPDGKILASAGDGGSLRLVDWKKKKELKSMKSGFGIVFSLAFSPEGDLLATGNSDSLVHLWDKLSGTQLKTFSGHRQAVQDIAFSPDGTILAGASLDGTVRFWDVDTGRPRGILKGHSGAVNAVAFSLDGNRVISGGKDGTVRLWDWKSSRQLALLTEHRGPVWTIAVSSNGSWLASGGRDRNVRIMPVQSSSMVATKPKPSQKGKRDTEVGPPPVPPPQAEADLSIHPHEVKPGETMTLTLTVKNTGKGPLYRFQGKTQSANPLLDGHRVYFGKIESGQNKTETLSIRIPQDHPNQEMPFQVAFEEYNGFIPRPLQALVMLTGGGARPRLAYNYQVMDDGSGQSVGNGDGRIQKGEAVDILLTLKNVGDVLAKDTWVELENTPGQHLEVRPSMIRFGQLAPHQSKQARLSFTVWPDFPKNDLAFHVSIQEKALQIHLNEQLALAIDPNPPQQIVATNKIIRVTSDNTAILSGAGSESSVIATVNKDQSLAVTGELGDWYRVAVSEKETGWIAHTHAKVEVATAKGSMPIPIIQGLEENRNSQFITLTEELKRAESERAQIEQVLQRREQEMEELRAKLEHVSTSQKAKLSTAQEQLEQERREQESIKNALKTREQEMAELRQQLASMSSTQTKLITIQEKFQQEQAQREQAEKAIHQHQSELAQLRMQLTEAEKQAQTLKTPPAIALASPFDGQKVLGDRIQLVGAAASERGIARVEIRVNNELLARRQGRGVVVVPNSTAQQTTLEFSESILLREGNNDILVIAYDGEQLSTTRNLNVIREVDKGKIWAVVIGISQYETVRPLKYADKDATAFHTYLVKDVGIPAEQISLLLNNQATLKKLKRTLGTDLKRKANPNDTVIIYYAGHGAPETDTSSPDGDGLEKYLIPYDADPQDLYTTGLPMREVETIFHRLAAERVIFISDSCYSGATAGRTFSTGSRRAVVSDNFLTRLSKGKGRVVLTASRAGEISEERDELGHGVFTYYLLEGLKGKADTDGDRVVTVDEVYSYVSKHVPKVTGQNQHPVKKGDVEGQLILGRVHLP